MPAANNPATPNANAAPARATIRMYRHGLGDCLLLQIMRDGAPPYRILFDCGLILGVPAAKDKMTEVVDHLKTTLGGAPLDLLVVTHAHWDHVSGFVQAKAAWEQITVDKVWFAWTENPADPDAKRLKSAFATAETAVRMRQAAMRDAGLAVGNIEALTAFLGVAGKGGTADAMRNAAKLAAHPEFRNPGEGPIAIPGSSARIFVLGPPRDEKALRKMDPSKSTPETYSLQAMAHVSDLGGISDRPFAPRFTIPLDKIGENAFLAKTYLAEEHGWRRIDNDWLNDSESLALLLDRAVNNSSLVLAIELEPGGDVLLFAADAQVGNWLSWLPLTWDLPDGKVTGPDLIARTIVYKVGHHASLNATLREHGVEKMARLQHSLVPVDAKQAADKGFGKNIPFGALLTALGRNGAKVWRSDEGRRGLFDEITV